MPQHGQRSGAGSLPVLAAGVVVVLNVPVIACGPGVGFYRLCLAPLYQSYLCPKASGSCRASSFSVRVHAEGAAVAGRCL